MEKQMPRGVYDRSKVKAKNKSKKGKKKGVKKPASTKGY
jgi:hypothetical protein